MLIIRNNIIPFSGYKAILICCFLFVRKNTRITDIFLNHEEIHSKQCNEMLWIFFYIWYLIEYLIKLLIYFNHTKAYRSISFEQESYNNEKNLHYLDNRKHFNWLQYVTKSYS